MNASEGVVKEVLHLYVKNTPLAVARLQIPQENKRCFPVGSLARAVPTGSLRILPQLLT